MNPELETLAGWSAEMARRDEDVAARPLWAQIHAEVTAYLEGGASPAHTAVPLFTDVPGP